MRLFQLSAKGHLLLDWLLRGASLMLAQVSGQAGVADSRVQ